MALYEPELGYYTSQKTRIGRSGDFYTSSHLHPAFGMMIGKQIEEMWEVMNKPSAFQIVEMGSGAGYLCKDILEYYKGLGIGHRGLEREIAKNLQYIIVELNPEARESQKSLLSDYSGKVQWVASIKELGAVRGCFLSNELLDAFPVHVIEMDDEVEEVFVSTDNEKFTEIKGPPSTKAIADYIKEFSIKLEKGYRTEINLEIRKWLSEIDRALKEGFILTIDYGYSSAGYYSEGRDRGTLLCYHGHQVSEDPYRNVGEQDITAHVNFSSLKKWGEDLGIKTIGFCKQGAFLISLGIDEVIAEIHKNSADYAFEVARIKRLILPGTMGETHKAIIQHKGRGNPALRGFTIKNRLISLRLP
ncbi:MAG: SAM-dependent methyltransferase [Thermodesulfovibrionales bacterium]|nr:SAM-dependent methyltransferase [Thermodesulfovibrionales bacterium]